MGNVNANQRERWSVGCAKNICSIILKHKPPESAADTTRGVRGNGRACGVSFHGLPLPPLAGQTTGRARGSRHPRSSVGVPSKQEGRRRSPSGVAPFCRFWGPVMVRTGWHCFHGLRKKGATFFQKGLDIPIFSSILWKRFQRPLSLKEANTVRLRGYGRHYLRLGP